MSVIYYWSWKNHMSLFDRQKQVDKSDASGDVLVKLKVAVD